MQKGTVKRLMSALDGIREYRDAGNDYDLMRLEQLRDACGVSAQLAITHHAVGATMKLAEALAPIRKCGRCGYYHNSTGYCG